MHGAAALLAPRPARTPADCTGVTVVGEFSRASGLGESARLTLAAFERLGVPRHAMDVGPLLPAHHDDLPSAGCSLPPEGFALVLHVNPVLLPLLLLRLPRRLLGSRLVIGYWAWELAVAPEEWRTQARFVHKIWAPSSFTAAALEGLLPGRVQVMPHPVAIGAAQPACPGRARFGIPEGAVAVLVSVNLASSFERKNPIGAVRAFRAAFGDRPDRVLLLKTGNPDHFRGELMRLFDAVAGAANIQVITDALSDADTRALMASADIVLSLHRSEGFGLVIAEAMLQGKPVIATAWSGNMDFMDETNAVPVPFRLIPVADPRGVYSVPGALWAEPDLDYAAAQLKRLAGDAEARAALGERARAAALRLDSARLAEAVRRMGVPF